MSKVKEALEHALMAKRVGGMSLFQAIQLGYPAGDNSGPWSLDAIASELALMVPITERIVVREVPVEKKAKPAPKPKAPPKKVTRRKY